jgi:hypothetical protein
LHSGIEKLVRPSDYTASKAAAAEWCGAKDAVLVVVSQQGA